MTALLAAAVLGLIAARLMLAGLAWYQARALRSARAQTRRAVLVAEHWQRTAAETTRLARAEAEGLTVSPAAQEATILALRIARLDPEVRRWLA